MDESAPAHRLGLAIFSIIKSLDRLLLLILGRRKMPLRLVSGILTKGKRLVPRLVPIAVSILRD